MNINLWIFEDTSKLTLLYVLSELNRHNIDYKKMTENRSVLLRLASGVELGFENTSEDDGLDINDFQLTAFSLITENKRRWSM